MLAFCGHPWWRKLNNPGENIDLGRPTTNLQYFGLNNIYSDKVHDIHKYNVKIVGSDSKPVAYLDHLLDML